jgi:uncharacterized protein (DUF1015 family)
MATILPFKGLRYNPEKIKDISNVITPPYDIISEDEREKYYQTHPNNIIRLILGKDFPDDNQSSNKYIRAAEFFDTWKKEKILIQDAEPAIYVYAQEFMLDNIRYTRRGFISLVRLEEFETGQIYPHEQTLAKPKEDRLKLMQACHANFSQVFAFYKDEYGKVSDILSKTSEGKSEMNTPPEIDFIDVFDVRNLLWAIRDKQTIKDISLLMKDKPLFIADGHHRYETALFYRNLVKNREDVQKVSKQNGKYTRSNGDFPCDYVMMMCVSMDDPGLQILPTHRLVRNVENLDPEKFKNSMNEVFEIREMGKECHAESLMQKLKECTNAHAFILYIGGVDKKFYMLKLRDKAKLDQIFTNEHSEWKSLDTGILHGFIFDKILGLKAENTSKSDKIKYIQSEEEAIALVNEGRYQLAFFLNPTRINQVRDIAIKRHKMPPKATYFYPKLMTGIVLRHIS